MALLSRVKVYADNKLVYDSDIEETALLKLIVKTAFNKGGTCELTMPYDHVAYDYFIGYKTIVTVYKFTKMIFRGRALFPNTDFEGNRTIICEGERCFLNDHIVGPFTVTGPLALIFRYLIIGKANDPSFPPSYNSLMNAEKNFVPGTVEDVQNLAGKTVTVKNEGYTPLSDLINELTQKYGGYITFSGTEDHRYINWLQNAPIHSNWSGKAEQPIVFGENLLSMQISNNNSDFATQIIHRGFQKVSGGTIDHSGRRDLPNQESFGIITKFFDIGEVSSSEEYDQILCNEIDRISRKVESFSISALDLSKVLDSYDTFYVGEMVRIKSMKHGIENNFYQLVERSEDLINFQNDTFTFGSPEITLVRKK